MAEDLPTPRLQSDASLAILETRPSPGLLLARGPEGKFAVDRYTVSHHGLTIGRGSQADWPVLDPNLSKLHARFWREGETLFGTDLGSTNGTFLRGERLSSPQRLTPGDVVRCGRCVLVVDSDVRPLLAAQARGERFGWVGPFHTGTMMARLHEAATVGRHVLLVGESGVGKEIAAQAFAQLLGDRGVGDGTLHAHNCARMTSADEATATLFGVGARVFSEVNARHGLLEEAHGSVLFLDEIHELPIRVQRSLLRFLEDGKSRRIGDDREQMLRVTLVVSTNLPMEVVERDERIAFDLRSRLHVVTVPPLSDRRADVPAIFLHYVRQAAERSNLDVEPVLAGVRTGHLEALCMLPFRHRNVRELIQLAETMTARLMVERKPPREVLSMLLAERFPDNPVVQRVVTARRRADDERQAGRPSHYETHRARILATYQSLGGNLSATARELRAQGIRTSRRWLAEYLKRWGMR